MWRLSKQFRFEAAHVLPMHDGKCARLHGHSWILGVVVVGRAVDGSPRSEKAGMLVDFGDISVVVKPLVEKYLDHHYLNETLPFPSPTSEEIARWVFDQIRAPIENLRVKLEKVVIEETCTSRAEYWP